MQPPLILSGCLFEFKLRKNARLLRVYPFIVFVEILVVKKENNMQDAQ